MKIRAVPFVFSSIFLPLLATTSCSNEDKDLWDEKITIKNEWINNGFKNTNLEEKFLKKLTETFNKIKNQDIEAKNYSDVSFEIQTNGDSTSMLNELKANNKEQDIAIISYGDFVANFAYINEDKNWKSNLKFKPVAQTSTLKFSWQGQDNFYYENGLETDPLRKLAIKNNEKWFKENNLEYPDWVKYPNKLIFDGSKYTNFYDKKNLTYVYRGAIYISGNKKERESIIKCWNDKDLNTFLSYNLVYKDTSKTSAFKYQVALMARHFNKTIKEINEILIDTSNNHIIKGNDAKNALGKKSGYVTCRIGFAAEGEMNWLNNKGNNSWYKPDNFINNKNYDDEQNDVVRVLVMTNPAPYDVVLARRHFNNKQLEILQKTLLQLSVEENTYGLYTGYNKFQTIDLDLFKKFILLQIQAESLKNLVNDIPEIN
ncbi:ABC transporter thiamine pyrophosphate-binding lipoprotein p37/Cypl [Mycoplasma elephantis]|uniref:ABC transporter thiamine pyrophosphate-binding lipoprotein p37/Cypl n=1 Tax=Mycoplasma elephantis TaxID=114882 RepID=UPI00068D31E8|nr:hypothetical protein [Mycoplasma elephantis]